MGNNWYYARGQERMGPYSWEQLQSLVASGAVTPDDHVWSEGMANWVRARQVPDLPFPQGQSAPPPIPVGAPVNYYGPAVAYPGAPRPNADLDGLDWVIVVLCSGVGCIIGIIRLIQGKPNGGKMLGYSLLFMFIWTVVRVFLSQM